MRPRCSFRHPSAVLLAAIVLQALVISLSVWPLDGVIAGLMLLMAWWRAGLDRSLKTLRALILITAPVLVVRIITDPQMETALEWLSYLARLSSAALIALVLLAIGGSRLIRTGVNGLLRPLPSGLRVLFTDLSASALFLLPLVLQRLRTAVRAGRVRYAGHRHAGLWFARPLRAAFITLSTVPRQRAEAMLVRRITAPPEPRERERGRGERR